MHTAPQRDGTDPAAVAGCPREALGMHRLQRVQAGSSRPLGAPRDPLQMPALRWVLSAMLWQLLGTGQLAAGTAHRDSRERNPRHPRAVGLERGSRGHI